MKKNFKKGGMLFIPLMMGCLIGCGRTEIDDGDDATKANLSIGTLDAGIGSAWLEEAAARFEEKYKESTEFEDGKVGVKVTVKASRSYDGTYLLNQTWNQDIMFTEAINYYALVNSGKVKDITDLMTADLGDYGDSNKTILSKIDPSFANFMKKDNKYYGVPFYETFYGFVYDVDLWKEDGLYFRDGGGFTNDLSKRAAGPDGQKGTYDDGMPATYKDLASLFNKLNADYGYSFVYSTDEFEYMANLMFNFWAMNEGYDNMNLQYKLSSADCGGKLATNLIDISDSGTITKLDPVEITKENAWKLQKTEAKYQVLKLMEDTFCDTSKKYFETKTKNTDAQSFFVQSKYLTGQACPMCVEGSWFENEASSIIQSVVRDGNERPNYAVMPIPRATEEQVGTEQTRLGLSQSYGVINSNCQNTKLAYEFMKFLHSEQELVNFTKSTGMTRPLEYTIDDTTYNSLSTYTQSLINIKKTHRIFFPYSNNEIAINHYDDFGFFHWAWNTEVNGQTYVNPWQFLTNTNIDASIRTSIKYFKGQETKFKKSWSSYIG